MLGLAACGLKRVYRRNCRVSVPPQCAARSYGKNVGCKKISLGYAHNIAAPYAPVFVLEHTCRRCSLESKCTQPEQHNRVATEF